MAKITKTAPEISAENKMLIIHKCRFSFDGNKYQMKKSECFAENIKGNNRYMADISFNIKGRGEIRLVAAFIDPEGKECAKLYVGGGEEFIAPPKTAGIRFEIAAFSGEKCEIEINHILIEDKGENKKRIVRASAVAVNYNAGERSFERNLSETLDAIDNAGVNSPDIIVATECFYDRNVWGIPLRERSIDLDGEVMEKFRERAKKYHCYIAFSLHIILENGNISNLGIIIGREGETVGTYKKTHISMNELLDGIEPGEEIKVFELDFGRVGIAICWDLFFPEMVRELHLMGAEIIINPTAGFEAERTAQRAKESGAYIITAATQAVEHTTIFDPEGEAVAKGEKGKNYICADIELGKEFWVEWLSCEAGSTRKNVFKFERRPSLYKKGREL